MEVTTLPPAMRFLLPLVLVLLGFAAFPPGDGASRSLRVSAGPDHSLAATHTVTIRYQRATRGALRAAIVTITPKRPGVRGSWNGNLTNAYAGSRSGQERPFRLRRNADGSYHGRAFIPARRDLVAFLLRTSEDETLAYSMPQAQESDDDEEEPAPDPEPEPEPDPEPEPEPEPDPEPEQECTPPPCSGMVDPFTCQCVSDMKNPWPEDPTTEPNMISFGI